MRKIPTLFVRDPDDMRFVLATVNPAAKWVFDEPSTATRKYNGTCVMLDDDFQWWARREVKQGKPFPPGYAEVETDPNTGKTVGWEPIQQSPFAKAWATVALDHPLPGTYELIGPKVNGNPEKREQHELIRHADAEVLVDVPLDFSGLPDWLDTFDGEGIVWHHKDGRMAKLKRRDFPKR